MVSRLNPTKFANTVPNLEDNFDQKEKDTTPLFILYIVISGSLPGHILSFLYSLQDVGANEKDFASLSGLYDMSLLVGDAVIDNPITWSVCPVQLSFLGRFSAAQEADQYKAKPTITHMFR